MLRRFYIDNFKSLVDFSIPPRDDEPLGQLVCLVGINGSGKSTVLQAFDFVANLMVGKISQWLIARNWEANQLASKRIKKRLITFSLEFYLDNVGTHTWSGSYNPQQGRCTHELLSFEPVEAFQSEAKSLRLSFDNGVIRDQDNNKIELTSDFQGSVFGTIRLSAIPSARMQILLLRYYLGGVKSMELLSPHLMRKQSRDAADVGFGGEKIAAFVNGLDSAERDQLFITLHKFYPRLVKVGARSGKYGWKRLFASEQYLDEMESDSRHINDGFLRLAAIIAQTVAKRKLPTTAAAGQPYQKEYQFILLDELENGINPELVERFIEYLISVRQQIFFTTHSPIILNYLPDEKAKESVFLIFRNANGTSSCVRLFGLPELKESLETMGPGEAYMDVGLERISNKLSSQPPANS